MNRIWFFGDTFTSGHGCNPNDQYYELYPSKRHKKWTTLLSEDMDLIECNLGGNGLSNENIIIRILDEKQNFHKNDIVVIGITDPIKSFLVRSSDRKFGEVFFDPNLPDDFWINNGTFNDYEEHKIHKQYFDKFKYPYQEEWLNFHLKMIEFIKSNLENKVVLWNSKLVAPMFETIEKDTESKIKGIHYSWNGHIEMYNWIKNKINNEK